MPSPHPSGWGTIGAGMSMHKKMIYRLGGNFKIGDNMFELKTFDHDVEGELEKHLADGWFEKPGDATRSIGIGEELSTLLAEETQADAEREGLEAKAKSLGIGFNIKTTNETLQQRIDAAAEA